MLRLFIIFSFSFVKILILGINNKICDDSRSTSRYSSLSVSKRYTTINPYHTLTIRYNRCLYNTESRVETSRNLLQLEVRCWIVNACLISNDVYAPLSLFLAYQTTIYVIAILWFTWQQIFSLHYILNDRVIRKAETPNWRRDQWQNSSHELQTPHWTVRACTMKNDVIKKRNTGLSWPNVINVFERSIDKYNLTLNSLLRKNSLHRSGVSGAQSIAKSASLCLSRYTMAVLEWIFQNSDASSASLTYNIAENFSSLSMIDLDLSDD